MSDMETKVISAVKDAAITTAGAVGVGFLSERVFRESLGMPTSAEGILKLAGAIGLGRAVTKMLMNYYEKKNYVALFLLLHGEEIKMNKFFEHPVVLKMCFNNYTFFDKVHSTGYDYHRFARKMAQRRWDAQTIVKFLAFGVRIGLDDTAFWEKKKRDILKTLDDECPRWRAKFYWAVLFYRNKKLWRKLQAQ